MPLVTSPNTGLSSSNSAADALLLSHRKNTILLTRCTMPASVGASRASSGYATTAPRRRLMASKPDVEWRSPLVPNLCYYCTHPKVAKIEFNGTLLSPSLERDKALPFIDFNGTSVNLLTHSLSAMDEVTQ